MLCRFQCGILSINDLGSVGLKYTVVNSLFYSLHLHTVVSKKCMVFLRIFVIEFDAWVTGTQLSNKI